MKARAGLLMLLMCIISFTGFSTTTDLNQNSTAVTNADYDVGDIVTDFVVTTNTDFTITKEASLRIVNFFDDYSKEIVSKQSLVTDLTCKELYKPPVYLANTDAKHNRLKNLCTDNSQPSLKNKISSSRFKDNSIYRKARDSFRMC
ncbi:MAG: hypothetical protein V3V28_09260 [Polaribacter sp.]|uniref:hypothetical protein n=1 Tax=Polaribacter sp. TaxID=1920175 RepID=UPI002F356F8D